jgi:hypothetical protein
MSSLASVNQPYFACYILPFCFTNICNIYDLMIFIQNDLCKLQLVASFRFCGDTDMCLKVVANFIGDKESLSPMSFDLQPIQQM